MRKDIRIWIFLAAAIGLVVLYLVLFGNKRINWSEDYVLDKGRAKGMYFITELLRRYDSDRKFKELDEPIHLSLKKAVEPSNYIFIGEDIYLVDNDADVLLDFVSKGNNAFIFTENLPEELFKEFNPKPSYIYYESKKSKGAVFSLDYPDLYLKQDSCFGYNRYGYSERYWQYIKEDSLELIEAEVLGRVKFKGKVEEYRLIDSTGAYQINNHDSDYYAVNYFRVKYGDGYFYFHTDPVVFSNVHLIENNNLDYVSDVFSYLNKGDLLWEEHNWVFKRPYLKRYVPRSTFFRKDESVLKMILENQELKWGWYGLLLMGILFVIFNGKRKQATIPILADRSNTTLIQIKKMGYLYKDVGEYFEITQNMFENFLWYLHVKLNIDTHQDTEKIIRDILKTTKYDEDEIRSIFSRYQKIENWKSVTHGVFIKLHDDIEKFYQNLK